MDLVGQFAMVEAKLPSTFNNVYNVTVIPNDPSTQTLGIDNLVYAVSK